MTELQKDQKTYGVGVAIPARRPVVKIDQAKATELRKWSEELRAKFEEAAKS